MKVLSALCMANHVLKQISEQAGDVPFWNVGGEGYETHVAVLEAIAILKRKFQGEGRKEGY